MSNSSSPWPNRLTHSARVLLGLLFVITGSNGFLNFMPMPKDGMSEGAIALSMAMLNSGYLLKLVMATQFVSGLLILSNRFVALGLILLAPVLVNIFFFHAFLAPAGLGMASVLSILEIVLAWRYRAAFKPLFVAKL